MNKKIFFLSVFVLLTIFGFGQNEQKIVIIKSGKNDVNMDSILSEHKINKNVMVFSSDTVTKDISVTKDDKGYKIIKIVKKGGDGKEEIIEWKGDGDMPAELEKEMKNIEINTNTLEGTTTVTVETEEDGKSRKDKKAKNIKGKNKSQLGIIIDDSEENGVVVTDFADDSPALKAGLKRGDTILKIGDNYIFSIKSLRKAMLPYDKGDSCPLVVLRLGKEKKIKVKL